MSENSLKLRNYPDPSDIFEIINISENYKKKYRVFPLIIEEIEGKNRWFSAKNLIKKNIIYRDPFLYKASNAIVFGHSHLISNSNLETSLNGLVFNKKNPNKIFGEEKGELNNNIIQINYTKTLEFKIGFFIGGHKNFGHWLLNHLGRLSILSELDFDLPIVVPNNLPKRYLDCIKYFLKKNYKIIEIPPSTKCTFKELYFSNMPWFIDLKMTWFTHESAKYLNNNFIKKNKNKSKNKKIFLSRELSKWRKLSNENEIWEQLKYLGFEKIHIENLTINEQINLGGQCEVVVSVFGAGSNFFLFTSSFTKCIELRPPFPTALLTTGLMLTELGKNFQEIIGVVEKKDGIPLVEQDFKINSNINWNKFFN